MGLKNCASMVLRSLPFRETSSSSIVHNLNCLFEQSNDHMKLLHDLAGYGRVFFKWKNVDDFGVRKATRLVTDSVSKRDVEQVLYFIGDKRLLADDPDHMNADAIGPYFGWDETKGKFVLVNLAEWISCSNDNMEEN